MTDAPCASADPPSSSAPMLNERSQRVPDSDSSAGIPAGIRGFIRQHIPTLHQLEILLCIYTPPLQTWRADTIALQLYLPLDLVEERLADLVRRGLIQATETAPHPVYAADAAQVALIDQLAAYYRQHRITLTTFIFTQPSDVVQSFADAFKVRKES